MKQGKLIEKEKHNNTHIAAKISEKQIFHPTLHPVYS
jgi:hypothetical protein